jgi:predicted transcriptional regulator of viral defense system
VQNEIEMDETLKEIFEANNGYLETKVLKKRSEFYRLKEMVKSGDVTSIKRGLYRLTIWNGENELAEVCRIVPLGVICLFSAWHYYELTTFVPSKHYIAIPSKTKRVLPAYPPIQLIYREENSYKLGQIETEQQGGVIRIYNLEKSVCDAIKFRNKVGEEQSNEVLKNYLKRTDRNLDRLLKYARQLNIENILQQFLKLLI